MRCRTARALLPLLLDNVLPLGDHHEVEEHFHGCEGCARFRAQLESELPPLPDLPEAVLSRFRRELDFALEAEICRLNEQGGVRAPHRSMNVPRPRMWAFGVLLGATTSLFVFGAFRFLEQSTFAREMLGTTPPVPISSASYDPGPVDWPIDYRADSMVPCTANESSLDPLEPGAARATWAVHSPGSSGFSPTTVPLPPTTLER